MIFNLHAEHAQERIAHTAAAFRRLIDMAIRRGGSYFLTYHKYATRSFPSSLARNGSTIRTSSFKVTDTATTGPSS